MELSIAKDLDRILNFLNTNKNQDKWFELLDELKIDKKNKELLFKELDLRTLIDVRRVDGGNHFIRISPDGKAFLQSSSFVRLRTHDKKSVTKNRFAFIIDNSNKIISVVGVVFIIYLGVLNYNKNIIINDLNAEIKILKQEKKLLQDSLSSKPTFKISNNKTTK